MHRPRRIILGLPGAALLLVMSCGAGPTGELAAFEWLLGDWVADGGGTTVSERWRRVSDQTFEGRGVTTSGDRVTTETMRLVAMGDSVFFIAKVAHNELPVAFRLDEMSDSGRAVFRNPAHDFPRQIVYAPDGPDTLVVTVSDGADSGFELRFSRR